MEALVVGAMRGMAEAHWALREATHGVLPDFDDLTMLQVSEIMAALLLEESNDCRANSGFHKAARSTGRNVLGHLETFRAQREHSGEGPLYRVLEQAGLDRTRSY